MVIPNPGLNKVIYMYVNKVILYVRNYHFVANVPTSVAIYDDHSLHHINFHYVL